MSSHDETASWYEWKEQPAAGHTTVEYLRNCRGIWRRAELTAGEGGGETKLLRARQGERLRVVNRGPDVVTLCGEDSRTEVHDGEAWSISERRPFGNLESGHSEEWICGDETVVATVRPECFGQGRPEYLEKVWEDYGRRNDRTARETIRQVIEKSGGSATKRRGRGGPDYDVLLGGEKAQKSVWAVKSIEDEHWLKNDLTYRVRATKRTPEQTVTKEAQRLQEDSRQGTVTVLVLMCTRTHDPHAVTEDEIAQALFGGVVIAGEGAGPRTVKRNGQVSTEHLKNVSVVATVSVTDLVPKDPDRGIEGSRIARNTRVMYTTRMYVNPYARVPVQREMFEGLRAGWWVREKAPERPAHLITTGIMHEWDGWVEMSWRETWPSGGVPGTLKRTRPIIEERRDKILAEAMAWRRDNEGLTKDEVAANHRTFTVETTPAESRGEWIRYVYEKGADDRTARIVGCAKTVTDVLEMLLGGETAAGVSEKAPVNPGGKRLKAERAAIRIAAAWAGELSGEKDNRPGEGDGIEITHNICFGKPRLKGTRSWLGSIFESLVRGMEVEEAGVDNGTDRVGVLTAIRYGLKAVRAQEKRSKGYGR